MADEPRSRRGVGTLVAGGALALAIVLAFVLFGVPGRPDAGHDSFGDAPPQVGLGPGGGTPAARGTGPAAAGQPTTGAPPITTAGPAPEPGHLTVTHRVVDGGGLLSYGVEVTIANDGGLPATWHTVTLRVGGPDLAVVRGVRALVDIRGSVVELTPEDPGVAEVPPGKQVVVSFVVNGLLQTVNSCTLDGGPCT